MVDRYTKTILTIIACALTVIATQQLTKTATAQSAACGSASYDPCYVRINDVVTVDTTGPYGMSVYVTNK